MSGTNQPADPRDRSTAFPHLPVSNTDLQRSGQSSERLLKKSKQKQGLARGKPKLGKRIVALAEKQRAEQAARRKELELLFRGGTSDPDVGKGNAGAVLIRPPVGTN
jgi:hypothetical protein